MHQVSRTVDSITLSWSQPDQPNGVILDYELQYYEKVLQDLGRFWGDEVMQSLCKDVTTATAAG